MENCWRLNTHAKKSSGDMPPQGTSSEKMSMEKFRDTVLREFPISNN